MKPISITIKGLNSFVEEQTIDFVKLSSQGLFGIFGPTGSGKSTVLDAITFALYGKIARETGSHSQYINTNVDSARVVFEFEVNADVSNSYKIIREIKKQKKGNVTTSQCKIIRTNDDTVLGEREREVREVIKKIIGLEYEDFVKTVVLPQGGFNDFLKMEGRDRRDILERLFNFEKYGKDLENKIAQEYKKVEIEQASVQAILQSHGDISAAVVEEFKNRSAELEEKLKELKAQKELSDLQTEKARNIFDAQKELEELRKLLADEEKKAPRIQQLTEELENARQASLLEPLIKNYDELVAEGKKSSADVVEKQSGYDELLKQKEGLYAAFEQAEAKQKNEQPRLFQRRQSLENAIHQWERYSTNKARLTQLQKSIESDEREILAKRGKQKEYLELRKRLEDEISESKKQAQENVVSSAEKNRLSEAVILFDKIEDIQNRIRQLAKEMKEQTNRRSDLKKEIEDISKRRESIREQKENLLKERESIKQNPLSDSVYIIEERQKFVAESERIQKIEQSKAELQILSEEMDKLNRERSDNENLLKKIDSEYAALQQEHRQLFIQNSANLIREGLHPGDCCPVCQNIVGELAASKKDSKLEPLEAKLEQIRAQREECLTQKGLMDGRATTLGKEYEDKTQEVGGTVDIPNDAKELAAAFAEKEKQSEELKNRLKELEESIQRLAEEENKLQSDWAGKTATEQAIGAQSDKDEKLVEQWRLEHEKLSVQFEKLFDKSDASPRELLQKLMQRQEKYEEIQRLVEQKQEQKSTIGKDLENLQATLSQAETNLFGAQVQAKELAQNILSDERELMALLGQIGDPKPALAQVEKEIQLIDENLMKCKRAKEEFDQKERLQEQSLSIAKEGLKNLREMARVKQNVLYEKIQQMGIADFSDLDERQGLKKLQEVISQISANLLSAQSYKQKEDEITEHKQKLSSIKGEISGAQKRIGDSFVSAEEFDSIVEQNRELTQQHNHLLGEYANSKQSYLEKVELLEKVKELAESEKRISKKLGMLKELRSVLSAKKFVEFMALKQLNYITLEATERLFEITNGAYSLEVDDEGAFKIRDNKNGGALRNVKTLSGGETFVVSLSLALALSAQIQLKGVAPLELFFLDEGFGTLDDELLEVVMDSLERIHHDKLKIGIISHVEQLKQRIPVKLMITPAKMGEGGSKAKIEYS